MLSIPNRRRHDRVELGRELSEARADGRIEPVDRRVEPVEFLLELPLALGDALVASLDDALDLADAPEVLVVVGLDVGRREESLGRRRLG